MQTQELEKNFYTIRELMAIRSVKDRQSIHDWLKRNKIPTRKLDGNIIAILKSDVKPYLVRGKG